MAARHGARHVAALWTTTTAVRGGRGAAMAMERSTAKEGTSVQMHARAFAATADNTGAGGEPATPPLRPLRVAVILGSTRDGGPPFPAPLGGTCGATVCLAKGLWQTTAHDTN